MVYMTEGHFISMLFRGVCENLEIAKVFYIRLEIVKSLCDHRYFGL